MLTSFFILLEYLGIINTNSNIKYLLIKAKNNNDINNVGTNC